MLIIVNFLDKWSCVSIISAHWPVPTFTGDNFHSLYSFQANFSRNYVWLVSISNLKSLQGTGQNNFVLRLNCGLILVVFWCFNSSELITLVLISSIKKIIHILPGLLYIGFGLECGTMMPADLTARPPSGFGWYFLCFKLTSILVKTSRRINIKVWRLVIPSWLQVPSIYLVLLTESRYLSIVN